MWQLVASVATDYFTLREEDAELQIARDTLTARKSNLDLVQARYTGGISDLLSVRQAQESYYQVSASIPQLERQITLSEDALSTLIGAYPQDIPRGLGLDAQIALPAVPPAGLPSELLVRRPDIMQAEANLAAASANLDVARAMLYPQLSISATGGIGATAINGVFYGPEGLISIVPQLLAPIFNGGSLQANVRVTQAQRQAVAVSYLRTVQTAVQEVADSVVSYNKLRDATTAADQRTSAAQDATRLANLRYHGGVASYIEVLDAETRAYTDELDSVQSHLDERLALVQLYQALGGGWEP
jgi:multidrug efflux system outer membrane protein